MKPAWFTLLACASDPVGVCDLFAPDLIYSIPKVAQGARETHLALASIGLFAVASLDSIALAFLVGGQRPTQRPSKHVAAFAVQQRTPASRS